MSARFWAVILVALLLAAQAFAQGFGGLGTRAEGFAVPQRGTPFTFPRDHGAHPNYRIEWWYLTSNLRAEDGTEYGIQWTLFRTAMEPRTEDGWTSPQLWMGHAALTTPDKHYVAEVRARGGTGQAGVSAAPFLAQIDNWVLQGEPGQGINTLTAKASGTDFAFDLKLNADGPLVFHGDDGYSVKSQSGQASYYYSQPFYTAEGTLMLPDGPVEVTGTAWLDREWSSQPLAANQRGWDWVSLNFGTGEKLMAFRLRRGDGADFTSASWIAPDGRLEALPNGAVSFTPLELTDIAGRNVPTSWHIRAPERGLDIEVEALNNQAWMNTSVPYWEGPVRIFGSHAGRGYLEMTGYE
jgi:predicted secreted hydrolase